MKYEGPKKLLTIFLVMFRIGLFTFGGGLVMIPQMSRDFADRYGWIKKEELVDFFAVAQSLPGVIAVNASVLIGYRLAGVAGALAAAFGAVLPSFLVLLVVTVFYELFMHNVILLGAMRGIRAAVTALLFFTSFRLRKGSVDSVFGVALFLAAVLLVLLTSVNAMLIIAGGGLLGAAYMVLTRRRAKQESL